MPYQNEPKKCNETKRKFNRGEDTLLQVTFNEQTLYSVNLRFFFFFKLTDDVKRDLSLSEENGDERNENEGTRDEGKLRDKILLFKSLKESNKLRFLISFSLTQKPYVNIRASVFHFTLCRVKVWNF